MWLTIGTIGNHEFLFDLDEAEAEHHFALALESMNADQPVRGHLLVRPNLATRVAIRLSDIVTAEVSTDQPPPEEKG